jgi:hypothetical protein
MRAEIFQLSGITQADIVANSAAIGTVETVLTAFMFTKKMGPVYPGPT